jgi:hypothetical protein
LTAHAPTPSLTIVLLLLLLPPRAAAAMLHSLGVNLNWAADDGTAFAPHSLTGSLELNLASGAAAAAPVGHRNKLPAILAHGALLAGQG